MCVRDVLVLPLTGEKAVDVRIVAFAVDENVLAACALPGETEGVEEGLRAIVESECLGGDAVEAEVVEAEREEAVDGLPPKALATGFGDEPVGKGGGVSRDVKRVVLHDAERVVIVADQEFDHFGVFVAGIELALLILLGAREQLSSGRVTEVGVVRGPLEEGKIVAFEYAERYALAPQEDWPRHTHNTSTMALLVSPACGI